MRTLIKFFAVIFSIIFSFSLIFYGVTGDTFYWLNRPDFFKEEPFTVLTIWLTKIWINNTEKSVLSFRVLGWITCLISIFIPYFSLLKRNEYIKYLHYLAFGIILFATGTFKLFNPDTTTVLCLSIIFTLLIKYYIRPNFLFIIIIGIVIGLSIAFRFPNIVLLPILCLLIFTYNYYILKERYLKISALLVVTIIISISIYLLIIKYLCDSNDVISLITYKLQNPTEGVKSHNISSIINNYKLSFVYQMGFISTVFIGIYIIRHIYNIMKKTNIALLFLCIIFLYGLWNIVNINTDIFALSAILFACYITLNKKDNLNLIIFSCTLTSLSLVGIAGSDTGLSKIYPFISITMPILLVYYSKNNNITLLNKGLFITFIIFTIAQKTYSALQNKDIVEYYPLHEIKVSQNNAEYWKNIMNDINKYRNDNIVFYGVHGHALYTISNAKPIYTYSFWMYKDDEQELYRMFNSIKNQKTCLLVDLNKEKSSFFDMSINNLNMKLVKSTNKYDIYYYRNDKK